MKSLNGAAVVAAWSALAAGGAAHAQEAVQWRVEDGGNGHWYEVVPASTGIMWNAAHIAATSVGGHLATITHQAENEFVFPLTVDAWEPSYDGPWLGGFQDLKAADYSEPAGGWRWVTGEKWDYAPWDCVNPSNSGAAGLNEDRLHYSINPGCGPGPAPFLNDSIEQPRPGYVVEWSADCNGDGLVDYGQLLDGTFEDVNGNGVPDICECLADTNFDGIVNGADISVLLGFWGLNGKPVAADINKDGQVDGTDLANVLGSWGECP